MKTFKRLSRSRFSARRQSFRDDLRRHLGAETLEARNLMAGLPGMVFASQYYNARMPADVDNNGQVQINDALSVITALRQSGARSWAPSGGAGGEGEASASTGVSSYYDVNADYALNIQDALGVIQTLRAQRGEGEAGSLVEWTIKAVPAGAAADSLALTQVEVGTEYDLLVSVQDMRPRSSVQRAVVNPGPDQDISTIADNFVELIDAPGGLNDPRLNLAFDSTLTHAVSNESQYIILRGSSVTGTFKLEFDGQLTAAITIVGNTTTMATNIQNALQALPNIGTNAVRVAFSDASNTFINQNPFTGDTRRFRVDFFSGNYNYDDQDNNPVNPLGKLADKDVPALVVKEATLGGTNPRIAIDAGGKILDPTLASPQNGASADGRIEDYEAWYRSMGVQSPWDYIDNGLQAPDQALPDASQTASGLLEVGSLSLGLADPPDSQNSPTSFDSNLILRIRMKATAPGVVSFAGSPTDPNIANPRPIHFAEPSTKPDPSDPTHKVVPTTDAEREIASTTAAQGFPTVVPSLTIVQYVDARNDLGTGNSGFTVSGATPLVIPVVAGGGGATADVINVGGSVTSLTLVSAGTAPASPTLSDNYFSSTTLRSRNNGILQIVGNTVQYTADPAFVAAGGGIDEFVYTVQANNIAGKANPDAYRDTALVRVNVVPPVLNANNDSLTVAEAGSFDLNLVSNASGSDSLGPAGSVRISQINGQATTGGSVNVTGGVVTFLNSSNTLISNSSLPQIRFTPTDIDAFGSNLYTFTYTLIDAASSTDTATVTLTVTNVNDAPVANILSMTVDQGSTGALAANKIDVTAVSTGNNGGPHESDAISLFSFTQPAVGTGAVTALGNVLTFVPANGFSGNTSFTYVIRDNGTPNLSSPATTINVTVRPTGRPSADDDAFNFNEGSFTALSNSPANSYALDVLNGDVIRAGQTAIITTLDVSNVPGTISVFTPTGFPPQFAFTPDAAHFGVDYFGTFTFTYHLEDGLTAEAGADQDGLVTVTIANVNDPPTVPGNLSVTVGEDSGNNTINVVGTGVDAASVGPANEIPLDSFVVVAPIVTQPTKGTLTIGAAGNVIYRPNDNEFGSDFFVVTLADRATGGLTVNRRVDVTITAQDDLAVAATGTMTVVEDSDGTLAANKLDVTNISGTNAGPLETSDSVHLVSASVVNPALGTVSIAGNVITFVPTPNYFGPASISYTITDDLGNATPGTRLVTGTINVSVTSGNNDPPTAGPGSFSLPEDPATPFVYNLVQPGVASPGPFENITADPITITFSNFLNGGYTLNGNPAHGTVAYNVATGQIQYTPAPDFFGTETFDYTVQDSKTGPTNPTATATITVTVTSVNDDPHANPDLDSTTEGASKLIDVLTNDDVGAANETPPQSLTITAVSVPTATVPGGIHGTAVIQGTQVLYTPAPDFYGTDTFTYTISDGAGGSKTGNVTVTVSEVNDQPSTTPLNTSVFQFLGNTEIGLSGNISISPDDAAHTNGTPIGETLTITGVGPSDGVANFITTRGGVVTLVGGKVFYDPTNALEGIDTFQYTVTDSGRGGTGQLSNVGNVTVDVKSFVPANVGGFVFHDKNNNGVKDLGETGFANVAVTLKSVGTNVAGQTVDVTKYTGADGSYLFPQVVPGDYKLIETQPKFIADGLETIGAQGGSLLANDTPVGSTPDAYAATDTIFFHLETQGTPSGALGNNFAELGVDLIALSQNNSAYNIAHAGSTLPVNTWREEMLASTNQSGFLYYMQPTVGFYQSLSGWANVASMSATLSSDKLTLTLTVVSTPATGSVTKVAVFNNTTATKFRIVGTDESGGYLIRIGGTAEEVFGVGNAAPFKP